MSLDGAFVHRWGGSVAFDGTGGTAGATMPTVDPTGHLVVVMCESNTGFVQRFRGTLE